MKCATIVVLVMLCIACNHSDLRKGAESEPVALMKEQVYPIIGKYENGHIVCNLSESECISKFSEYTNKPVFSAGIVKHANDFFLRGESVDGIIMLDLEYDQYGYLRLLYTGKDCNGCNKCKVDGTHCDCVDSNDPNGKCAWDDVSKK